MCASFWCIPLLAPTLLPPLLALCAATHVHASVPCPSLVHTSPIHAPTAQVLTSSPAHHRRKSGPSMDLAWTSKTATTSPSPMAACPWSESTKSLEIADGNGCLQEVEVQLAQESKMVVDVPIAVYGYFSPFMASSRASRGPRGLPRMVCGCVLYGLGWGRALSRIPLCGMHRVA